MRDYLHHDDKKKRIAKYYDGQVHDFDRTRYGSTLGDAYFKIILSIIKDLLGDLFPGALIDLGSGTGKLLEALDPQSTYSVALDISHQMLLKNREALTHHPRTFHVQGDIESLPFDDRTFDAAIAIRTLRFLTDLERSFFEIFRVLRPGGLFVFNYHNTASPKWKLAEWLTSIPKLEVYDIPRAVMNQTVGKSGFVIEEERGAIWLPWEILRRVDPRNRTQGIIVSFERALDSLLRATLSQLIFVRARKPASS